MGNDDLFAQIAHNGKFFRLLCDNTDNAIAITTAESQEWLYWNERAEELFGQGFHRKTWGELSPYPDELRQDMALCEDVVNGVTPNPFYFKYKHYTNIESGKIWFARCEFYLVGEKEIDGRLQHIFVCIIRKIDEAMDPEKQTQEVTQLLVKRAKEQAGKYKKPMIYAALTGFATLITALTGFMAELSDLRSARKPITPDDMMKALQAYTEQYANTTNSFE